MILGVIGLLVALYPIAAALLGVFGLFLLFFVIPPADSDVIEVSMKNEISKYKLGSIASFIKSVRFLWILCFTLHHSDR